MKLWSCPFKRKYMSFCGHRRIIESNLLGIDMLFWNINASSWNTGTYIRCWIRFENCCHSFIFISDNKLTFRNTKILSIFIINNCIKKNFDSISSLIFKLNIIIQDFLNHWGHKMVHSPLSLISKAASQFVPSVLSIKRLIRDINNICLWVYFKK